MTDRYFTMPSPATMTGIQIYDRTTSKLVITCVDAMHAELVCHLMNGRPTPDLKRNEGRLRLLADLLGDSVKENKALRFDLALMTGLSRDRTDEVSEMRDSFVQAMDKVGAGLREIERLQGQLFETREQRDEARAYSADLRKAAKALPPLNSAFLAAVFETETQALSLPKAVCESYLRIAKALKP